MYTNDPTGGNQPETDLAYSLATQNSLLLDPIDDPLQSAKYKGLGCACSGGLGDITLPGGMTVTNTELAIGAAALAAAFLLFGRTSKRAKRRALARERDRYLSAKYKTLEKAL